MKIRIPGLAALAYILLFFILVDKRISALPIAILTIAVAIDHFLDARNGIKNLFYIAACFATIWPIFLIFIAILPFAVFGFLLSKGSFVKNYVMGFALSFIPINVIYLLTTYFNVRLNYPLVLVIFYSIPLIAIFLLQKKSLDYYEIGDKEMIFVAVVLFFTSYIAAGIINENELFIANGVRIFTRVQVAFDGLSHEGIVPIYNPGIAQGDPTYLWNAPSFKVHVAVLNYILYFIKPLYFFNSISFFILLLSTLSLGAFFRSFISDEKDAGNLLIVLFTTMAIGLHYYFIQLLESFKANYTYPIAYLLLSMIIDNPKKFREFVVIMYISALIVTIHLPYGSGVLMIAGSLILLRKLYYLRDSSELKEFARWAFINKFRLIGILIVIILIPLFYLSAGIIFNEFLDAEIKSKGFSLVDSIHQLSDYLVEIGTIIKNFFTLEYPDQVRLDDHRVGAFVTIFGALSVALPIFFWKSKSTRTFWVFSGAFFLNLVFSGLFYSKLSTYTGGFWRTTYPYLLIIAGCAIITSACLLKNKVARYIAAAIILSGFLYSVNGVATNLENVHKESFASGTIYQGEIDFIRKLPPDGRIMSYGLFNNAIDFGGNYLTNKYFSRDERNEFNIKRRIYEKVHGQNSFGEEEKVLTKKGDELYNYLRLGGWKYLFLDARHPIAMHVITELSPELGSRIYKDFPESRNNSTNYAKAIYMNGPLAVLELSNVSYVEKIELVNNFSEDLYKKPNGYMYETLSPFYDFDRSKRKFVDAPKEPVPLHFERNSPTEVRIFGAFDDDYVVFKEYYFTRWKAFMNDVEVPVSSTFNELVLIETKKGTEIVLKYVVLPIEKVFGALSLAATLLLVIVFFSFRPRGDER